MMFLDTSGNREMLNLRNRVLNARTCATGSAVEPSSVEVCKQ